MITRIRLSLFLFLATLSLVAEQAAGQEAQVVAVVDKSECLVGDRIQLELQLRGGPFADPVVLEERVVYLVEQPSGAFEVLKPSEFQAKASGAILAEAK